MSFGIIRQIVVLILLAIVTLFLMSAVLIQISPETYYQVKEIMPFGLGKIMDASKMDLNSSTLEGIASSKYFPLLVAIIAGSIVLLLLRIIIGSFLGGIKIICTVVAVLSLIGIMGSIMMKTHVESLAEQKINNSQKFGVAKSSDEKQFSKEFYGDLFKAFAGIFALSASGHLILKYIFKQ